MSTQTTERPEGYIPGDDEVQVSRGGKAWRCASGKICRGSEKAGNLETREKITGRLRRIGVYEGEYQGERIYQLEADIETATGMERLKASLCDDDGRDKASGVALGIARGLLGIAKDELMIVTASQGTTENKYGKFPTFVNFFRLPDGATKGIEVPRRPKDNRDMDTILSDLLDEIKDHPAFAERPASESDEDGKATTHLSALCKWCEERAWPTPEQAPAEWLSMLASAFGHEERATIGKYSDDEWGDVRQKMANLKAMPKKLEPAKVRLSKAGAPKSKAAEGEDEYNPFEDE